MLFENQYVMSDSLWVLGFFDSLNKVLQGDAQNARA
jgi:hypothetical protein